MLIRRRNDIPGSEITPETVYRNRRRFIGASLAGAAFGLAPALVSATGLRPAGASGAAAAPEPADEALTPEAIIASYNNFYEFGMNKGDPARHAGALTTSPWPVEVTGECARPGVYQVEELIGEFTPEERVYRHRCVEAWSMVIPWLGIPLGQLLARFQPTGAARYVEFTSLHRPEEMPAQRSRFSSIDWPYVEGLRLDEARHPLAIMAVGLYGKPLPNQNGAPWRLVVPWKYGFKGAKSVVRIRFTRRQPRTTWNRLAPHEYGFYANVNPEVDHPRWSQATERRLPNTLFNPNRIPTRPFNGYGEQVASLYAGMDLRLQY